MAAGAQNLDMSGDNQSASFDASGKPTRGMSQASVESSFGAPQSSRQAVGDPPLGIFGIRRVFRIRQGNSLCFETLSSRSKKILRRAAWPARFSLRIFLVSKDPPSVP